MRVRLSGVNVGGEGGEDVSAVSDDADSRAQVACSWYFHARP